MIDARPRQDGLLIAVWTLERAFAVMRTLVNRQGAGYGERLPTTREVAYKRLCGQIQPQRKIFSRADTYSLAYAASYVAGV